MNIYLSGAIAAGRQKVAVYQRIAGIVYSLGHKITSPQVFDPNVTDDGKGEPADPTQIFLRDMQQLAESELVIAEISIPSLGVGYEIATAIHQNKPVLCLYDIAESAKQRISAIIRGNPSPLLTVQGYTQDTLAECIQSWVDHQITTRSL
ncbi:MAG: nucleoside 2-deoxyribosyltransferase [bacterium]|nr:nucleoside 2-deoxyribosyltransferase [bacterium]